MTLCCQASRLADPRRGGVLVIVLLSVALLTSLVLSAATAVRLRWKLADDSLRRAEARDAALSSIALAQYVLAADTNGIDHLDEPWADALQTAEIQLTDEESRIPLRDASSTLLTALFTQLAGLPQRTAATLAESTIAWRANLPSPPAAFECYAAVPGMDDGILARLEPFITLHGLGKVNINTVDDSLLAVLLTAQGAAPETTAIFCAGLRRARRSGFTATETGPDALAAIFLGENRIPAPSEAAAIAAVAPLLDIRSTTFRGTARQNSDTAPGIEFLYDRTSGTFLRWVE